MQRIQLLDYTRFFAAFVVMAMHYSYGGVQSGKVTAISIDHSVVSLTKYGYLGVPLFFMISGFVIFFSASNRSASQFAVSRATRLYPAYWFALTLTAIASVWAIEPMQASSFSQWMFNLSMLQSLLGVAHIDGVYWTLMLELEFYALVLLILMLGWGKKLSWFFLAWPVAMLLAAVFGLGKLPLLGGYFNFFASGALLAMLLQKCRVAVFLSLCLSFGLALQFLLSRIPLMEASNQITYSPMVVSVATLSFYALFISLLLPSVQALRLPGAKVLGAVTYPLYLIHAHLGYMAFNRWATPDNQWWLMLTVASVMLVLAYWIHLLVERRLASFWRRIFSQLVAIVEKPLQRSRGSFKLLRPRSSR